MSCVFADSAGCKFDIMIRKSFDNLRKYGKAPYTVAVVHGGPGDRGEMAPVAKELARERGVLEPLATAMNLAGQLEELRSVLKENGESPYTVIGHSYGAVLGFFLAARHPGLVHKLVMVGSAVFEESYAGDIMPERRRRLSAAENARLDALLAKLDNTDSPEDKNQVFGKIGMLLSKADACNLLRHREHQVDVLYEMHDRVWPEVVELRRSGALAVLGHKIHCPVTAIHGDCDPHPAQGVKKPLQSVLSEFKFVLLPRCGHTPWLEKEARRAFFDILRAELLSLDIDSQVY
jgi:pimeloyl-ACP methyl ester carboxylesterase